MFMVMTIEPVLNGTLILQREKASVTAGPLILKLEVPLLATVVVGEHTEV